MPKFTVSDSKITVRINKQYISSDYLHKCLYWYTNNFNIEILDDSNYDRIIVITPRNDSSVSLNTIAEKLNTDLIDYKTREIVYSETKNIRDLLVAKAFSHSDEYDDEPPGSA